MNQITKEQKKRQQQADLDTISGEMKVITVAEFKRLVKERQTIAEEIENTKKKK